MSNKGGRKSHTAAVTEEKEKRTDSPVKEMKKKIAANAEKEKQTTDKPEKTANPPEKTDKGTEKPQNEKADNKKAQSNEKVDKSSPTPEKNAQKSDKSAEKTDKNSEKEKPSEKNDKKTEKVAEKKAEKPAEKKTEKPAEKKTEPEKREEANGVGKEKAEKPKQNGAANGDANGVDTVSERDSSEEELVIDEQDEMFPELAYDDTSDGDDDAPSRSFTRRSQVKSTKTPETPRPASYKEDDSKEKILKMNDSLATDRKLRSADSPKREPKKPEAKKAQDSPKKDKTIDLTEDDEKEKSAEKTEKKEGLKSQLEMDVVIEVESMEELPESRTRTRARVSPYSRPRHDHTASSMTANYTGNNTTMEMDITENSMMEDNLEDSGYLRGLRGIRGRASYRPLPELATLNHSRSARVASANTSLSDARPTGTVVGRKRKPDDVEAAREATDLDLDLDLDSSGASRPGALHSQNKRMRLFDRIAGPFRGFNTRAAEIVGINTDLPLTAPVSSAPPRDPESLKPPPAAPLAPAHDADAKRCVVM